MKKPFTLSSAQILVVNLVLIFTSCSQPPKFLNPVRPISTFRTGIAAYQQNQPQLVVQLNHASPITAMSLSADGRFLVTASWDQTLRLWDATTGQELHRFEGHEGEVRAVALPSNSEFLLTGGKDGTARLWNTNTGSEIFRLKNHTATVTVVAFSADGQFVLTGSSDHTAKM